MGQLGQNSHKSLNNEEESENETIQCDECPKLLWNTYDLETHRTTIHIEQVGDKAPWEGRELRTLNQEEINGMLEHYERIYGI